MTAAFSHELCGGGGKSPVVPVEVGNIQVESLGDQGTCGDAPPGATQRARLPMTFVQHNRPCTVQVSCCTEVDVGDDHVQEGSEMFMTSRASCEVVASRDGEQVKNIRSNTLEKCDSFLCGERRKGRTRLGELDDVAVGL